MGQQVHLYLHQLVRRVGKGQGLGVELLENVFLPAGEALSLLRVLRTDHDLGQGLAHLEPGPLAGGVSQAGHPLGQGHVGA